MKKFLLGLLLLLSTPSLVFAADIPFFEFNPDYYNTQPLDVIFSATPSEIFIPQNDFINGFDLWLDNDGSSGPATFDFLSDDYVVLSKTVIIPRIPKIAGGQRFHVNIGQIPVDNSQKYSIRVRSSLPALRLFYSDRIKFVAHNAPYTSSYVNGAAMLGNEEMGYSFKFALYEGSETKIPIIKNLTAASILNDQAEFTFNADEPVDYKVEYGPRGEGLSQHTLYSGDYKFCGEGIDLCTLIIDVQPGRMYDFLLSAKDIWGNTAQATGSFTSAGMVTPTPAPTQSNSPTPTLSPTPIGDITPPIINNVRTTSITPNSVDIAWQTNEAADSFYLISYTTNLLSIAAGNDTTFELEHLVKTGPVLSPNTAYIARVTSRDLSGNEASLSFTFTTANPGPGYTPPPASPTPVPSPTTSGIPNPSQSSGPTVLPSAIPQNNTLPPLTTTTENNITTIRWTPPPREPADGYRVDVINGQGQLVKTQTVPAGTHETTINNLPAGDITTIVYANSGGTFEKVAKSSKVQNAPVQIQKQPASVLEKFLTLLPYILGGLVVVISATVLGLKYLKKGGTKKPPSSPPTSGTYTITYPG